MKVCHCTLPSLHPGCCDRCPNNEPVVILPGIYKLNDVVIPVKETKAVICPVCNGTGKVPTASSAAVQICHGCGGLGWVTISNIR